MQSNKITGLIIRKTNFSENDVIFEVLSSSGSLVSFFARGARKVRSRFAGVVQPGLFVDIVYSTGKKLQYPTEINLDPNHLFNFYTKSITSMNFFLDILTVTRVLAKDMDDAQIYLLVLEILHRAQNGDELEQIYNTYLENILDLIGVEHMLRCSFSGEYIHENEFFYIPESNKLFDKKSKPKTVDAALIEYDVVFQKQYLKKLIYEHISTKFELKF